MFRFGGGGQNFAEGRGNISGAFEYTEQKALYFTERDDQYGVFSGAHAFTNTQNQNLEPVGGNGLPDFQFLTGLRFNSISEGGFYSSRCPTSQGTDTAAHYAARVALNCNGLNAATPAGVVSPLGYGFAFDNAGNLIRSMPKADLRPFGSSYNVGGLGSTLLLTSQLDPGIKQYATNINGHYEFSPAMRFFVESKYVHVDAVQSGQPTFFNNNFSLTNPYISAQALGVLQTSLPAGATSFNAFRFNTDFGGRGEDHSRDLYRIVAGFTGTFLDTWKYELSFNYGHLDTFYTTQGNVVLSKYANSVNAVRNGAGQIVFGINAVTVTDPNCVPVDLFGQGAPSQAALNYFGYTSTRRQHADQYDVLATVSGDSAKLFSLPDGPIGFAFGSEYRRETAYSKYDDLTAGGGTFLNSIPLFSPPALVVIDGFAEVNLPVFKDKPFMREFTIQSAARVSNYNIGNTGTVFAYNAGIVYAPVNDLRFRGSYAVSIRAPTQSDLYATPSQTFLNGLIDPCDSAQINKGSQTRAANCAAAGLPAGFQNAAQSGISGLNGSNPNLKAEEGTSYTIGTVIQPHWVRGLSLSIDYYNIDIKNVIFTLAPQTIINQCYDSPSGINNQYCAAVFRNPDGTFKGQSDRLINGNDVPIARTGQSFLAGPFNFARQKTSGIDVDFAYGTHLSSDFAINVRLLASYLINRDNYTNIALPNFRTQQKLTLGDPEWKGSLQFGFTYKALDFNYEFRYIGRQTIGLCQTQNSVDGRPPQEPNAYPQVYYPDLTYSNFRIGLNAQKAMRFYAGVDNAFDQAPPFGLNGTGAGSGIYDNVGRFFYAGFSIKY